MAFTPQEQQLIAYGKANGKSLQEVKQALANFRAGIKPSAPAETPAAAPGVVERVGTVIADQGKKVQEAIAGEGDFAGQGDIRRGTEAAAAAADAIPKVAGELLPEPARQGLAALGQMIGKGFKFITDKVASTKLFDELGKLEADGYINKDNVPELYQLKDALGTAAAGGRIAGDILAADQAAKMAQGTVDVTKKVAGEAADLTKIAGTGVKNAVEDFMSPVMKRIKTNIDKTKADAAIVQALPEKAKEAISMGVTPDEAQLMSGATKETVTVMKRMLEKNPKGITTERPNVEIGDVVKKQIESVEGLRKEVGAKMGAEIKTVLGSEPVGTLKLKSQLADNLQQGGIKINGEKLDFSESSLTSGQQKVVQELWDTVTNLPLKTSAQTLLNKSDQFRAMKRELIRDGADIPRVRTANGETIDLFNTTAENVFADVAERSSSLRGLYNDYHKLSNILDDSMGTLAKDAKGSLTEYSSAQIGNSLRGLLSNTNSATKMLEILSKLESLSPSTVSIVDLVKFSGLLEDVLGGAANSFKGGVEAGVRRAMTSPAAGVGEMAMNKAAEIASKTVGTSAATRLKAIQELLDALTK